MLRETQSSIQKSVQRSSLRSSTLSSDPVDFWRLWRSCCRFFSKYLSNRHSEHLRLPQRHLKRFDMFCHFQPYEQIVIRLWISQGSVIRLPKIWQDRINTFRWSLDKKKEAMPPPLFLLRSGPPPEEEERVHYVSNYSRSKHSCLPFHLKYKKSFCHCQKKGNFLSQFFNRLVKNFRNPGKPAFGIWWI